MAPRRLRVLILGGYGVFGGRLARLLANEPDLNLLIAGRSTAKAAAFCATLKGQASFTPLALDRNGDLGTALANARPDIVVDASGPFQAYGEAPYRVIRACLAAGCHYLDLADAADFVAAVGQFDAAAKAAGLVVLSGVSTCPVLTAAAARELAPDFDRLDELIAGIGPSPYSGVGLNVVKGLTGYAGKPMSSGGRAFLSTRRHTISPPGSRPLRPRLFAVVDTPDGVILPRLFPGLRSVWFGAGPRPEPYLWLLIGLAWLVRWRLLPTAGFLAGLGHWIMNHLVWGEARGGMFVEARGMAAGRPISRSWHLVAEGDDGPFIPSMPAAALIRGWRTHPPAPGARDAAEALDLGDYDRLFSEQQIVTGVRGREPLGRQLYAHMLEGAFARLPQLIRDLHEAGDGSVFAGRARVERGRGPIAGLIAAVLGFPRATDDTPVEVAFRVKDGVETWIRAFGGQQFASTQEAGSGPWRHLLVERFGPTAFALAILVDEQRLTLALQSWRCLGVPMPLWLAPRIEAFETADGGHFKFHVEIRHPLAGRIIRYQGWLEPRAGA